MSRKESKHVLKRLYDVAYQRLAETDDVLSDQFLKAVYLNYPNEFTLPILFKILEQANHKYLYLMVNNVSNRSFRNDYYEIHKIIEKYHNQSSEDNPQMTNYKALSETIERFDYEKTLMRIKDIDKDLYNKHALFRCSEGFDADFIIKEVKNNLKGITHTTPLKQFSKKFELDECPICTTKKFKYVWLSCGHNICYHCFKILQSQSQKDKIKCPYCCSMTQF